MTRIQRIVVLLLAMLIVVFQSSLFAYFSTRPASFTLLGLSLILLAHQLRRRAHKNNA
jgi:hypothetical protein